MKISCYLIGEDNLLIQCADILLANDHNICGLISPLNSAKIWTKKNNIPYFADIKQFTAINPSKTDYFFSIVNGHILTDDIMDLAKKKVINYHNSLLPKYAGVNSTSWAIINGEKEHGVTWHLVTSKIDAGDILKQVKVPILENDTAFSLNLRCYEYAITSFESLLADIEKNTLSVIKQDLNQRSYYGPLHCLPNYSFINWKKTSVAMVCRLERASSFDHYNNEIGSLKIHMNGDYIIPRDLECLPKRNAKGTSGTILNISDAGVDVLGIDGVLRIRKCISKQGLEEPIKNILIYYDLKPGHRFLNLKNDSIKRISHYYSKTLKHERYWLSLIQQMTEHSIFSLDKNLKSVGEFQKLASSLTLDRLTTFNPDKKNKIILASILSYLYRLNNYDKFSVSLVHKNHQKLSTTCANMFSIFLPLISDWSPRISLHGILRHVSHSINDLNKKNTFFTDIFVRYPKIKSISHDSGIYINLSGNPLSKIPENAVLIFNYVAENNEVSVSHRFDVNNIHAEYKNLMSNMIEHISNILDKFINNPHINVSSFCFLTDFEKKFLVEQLGQGEKRNYSCTTIIDLFEHQVRINPCNVAIQEEHRFITYKVLWDMSTKFLGFIHRKKIKSKTLIGIYTDRSIEMMAVILGILRAQCVYVPLDTRYPMMKIETICRLSDLSWIISSDKFIHKLTEHFLEKQTVTIYGIKKIFNASNKVKINFQKNTSEKLAYVMFTSGTTGDPKGVMVTQMNIINYCLWFAETTNFNQKSSIDFSSSIAFDLSVPCTIAPLLVGGKIVICSDKTKTNPKAYLNYLIKYQISHVELTPGYLEMLLSYPSLISKLKDLKVLLLGADVLPIRDALKWAEICPHHKIVNEYGPTETTVSATSYFIGNNIDSFHFSVPIGRPGYNTSCYILDSYENLCPIGMKGELHIGGAQVTNGYLSKPMLTKDKFISSIFNDEHQIVYKTGDLVSWLPCGNLQFYGRNDFQVKIQGYRVELTGIEAVLLKIPQIQQAVVLPKNEHYKEKYLCAYLVMTSPLLSGNEIKSILLSYLPSYMIPREFYLIDHVPLKQNEKIDFVALEQQSNTLISYEYTIHKNMSEYESCIAKVWQEAFHNHQITVWDDFFDIGGDSFIAVQIIGELKNHYKVEIPLSHLFEYPTIELLARSLESICSSKKTSSTTIPSSIVRLSENSAGIPIFLIHPVGGSIFWYKQLATHLNEEYTVYGIQDISIDGTEQYFKTLEEMAKHYLDEIEGFAPNDGYYIGGASFGATVAFEMAHQILKRNKKIYFLGIFDGWAKYPDKLMQTNSRKFLQHIDDLEKIEFKKLNYLSSLENYRQKLLLKYQIQPLNTKISLFKASEIWDVFASIDDPYNGWKPYAKYEITNYMVPGNHETMFFGENVGVLGNLIKKSIKNHE